MTSHYNTWNIKKTCTSSQHPHTSSHIILLLVCFFGNHGNKNKNRNHFPTKPLSDVIRKKSADRTSPTMNRELGSVITTEIQMTLPRKMMLSLRFFPASHLGCEVNGSSAPREVWGWCAADASESIRGGSVTSFLPRVASHALTSAAAEVFVSATAFDVAACCSSPRNT